MARDKKQKDFAKRLLLLSIEDGEVKAERVTAIINTLKSKPPFKLATILRAYLKLVKKEVKQYTAILEHSGAITDQAVLELENELSSIYGRRIHVVSKENDELIAGVRVSISDDVYENNVISRMRPLRSLSL